ncbi:MAG TPA: transcription antitermination factor NusB [bacterium]|nr:transcription antitermination factor NusB [bacterium]
MNRHLSRMIAMQTLYEWEFRNKGEIKEIEDRNISEYDDRCEPEFIKNLVEGVVSSFEDIDDIIIESAPEWPLEQISLIDRAVLRLGIYELLNDPTTPHKVIINEAIELSKQFGNESSSKFVNGVLGTVYKKHEKEIEKIRQRKE